MSIYYTPPPQVIDGDIAYAKDVNDVNNETDSGFSAVEADFNSLEITVAAWAELARKWAEEAEDVEVEPGQYSALHWSAKSDGFAQNSAASAVEAFNSASAALVSENSAAADAAQTAADRVQTELDAAATAADLVETNQDTIDTAADRVQTGLDATTSGTNATNAANSAAAALVSETNAAASEQGVADDADRASNAANAAEASETAAAGSASAASISAANALTSETNAATSEANVAGAEAICLAAEAGAVQAYDDTVAIFGTAQDVEDAKAITAANVAAAEAAEDGAQLAETGAQASESTCTTAATTATNAANAANSSASSASISAGNAATSELNAAISAGDAIAQANRAEDEADRAEAAASSIVPSPVGEIPGDTILVNETSDGWVFGEGGGGGGGGLEWQAVQTADVTAESGEGYPMDTTAGELTVTLPLNPVLNDQVGYKDAEGQFVSYPLTIDPNGELIEGLGTFRVTSRGAGGTLVYSGDATIGWLLVSATPTGIAQIKPMIHVQDQKTTGTAGGTPTAAAYNDRDLTTVVTNEIAGATLVANEVTLPAGKYYITARAPSFRSLNNRVDIRKSDDTTLLVGETAYNYTSDTVVIFADVKGELTLTESTTIKVSHYITSSFVDNGMGTPSNLAPYESYTDLQIWQLDALIQTPVLVNDKLYPLPGNTLVTGNMHGLDYVVEGLGHTVTVEAGICIDSTNQVVLTAATQQVVTVPSVINTVYNLFLCDDGVVRTDTDVDGANLSAYDIRWIGFVTTKSDGTLCRMLMRGSFIFMTDTWPDWFVLNVPGDGDRYVLDPSPFLPVDRMEGIWYTVNSGGSTDVFISMTGTSDDYRFGPFDINLIGLQGAGVRVPSRPTWIRSTNVAAPCSIAQVKLKR